MVVYVYTQHMVLKNQKTYSNHWLLILKNYRISVDPWLAFLKNSKNFVSEPTIDVTTLISNRPFFVEENFHVMKGHT
jgi:hypothetical protein